MSQFEVFVQFREDGTNAMGLAYSIEPRKWSLILLDIALSPSCLGINRDITAFGYSEWPTSFNIRIQLEQDRIAQELLRLREEFPGAVAVNIFVPMSVTPQLQPIRRKAEVIQFPLSERIAA